LIRWLLALCVQGKLRGVGCAARDQLAGLAEWKGVGNSNV
jgi:hypothetical protein